MKKVFVTAAAAAALLVTGLAATADVRVQALDSRDRLVAVPAPAVTAMVSIGFRCEVSGTPVEFPNDIRLTRVVGATTAGTSVAYAVPGGHTGVVTLPALAAGQSYHVSNAVPGGLPAGTACTAAVN